jgi:hypothetical protein
MRLAAGKRLGPYEVISALGAGGIGVSKLLEPDPTRIGVIDHLPSSLL